MFRRPRHRHCVRHRHRTPRTNPPPSARLPAPIPPVTRADDASPLPSPRNARDVRRWTRRSFRRRRNCPHSQADYPDIGREMRVRARSCVVTICPIPKSLTAQGCAGRAPHQCNSLSAMHCGRAGRRVPAPRDCSDARRCEPAEQVHDARVRMGERESHGLCVATRRATRSSSGCASRLLDICPTRQRARGRCGAALAARR